MNNWKPILFGIGFILLAFLWTISIATSYEGNVRIVNATGESIRSGELEVCSQKFKIGEIEPGKSFMVHYKVKSDSQYKLAVEFRSGRKLTRELGYVTNGRNFKDVLTLKEDDVSIEEQ